MSKEKEAGNLDLKPEESLRVFKNVIVISIAFMLQFTAYSGAANLQSSINAEAGLGTASLAAVYAGFIFSSIFLPVAVIKWLGTKWTISLSFLTYMPYIAVQFYPGFYTMIPAGLIVGFGGGPLWCAKCTYLSVVSEAYSKISNISAEALLTRFLGLFFMIFQMNQVSGNLISSLLLTSGNNSAAVTSVNASMIPLLCGANFLPSSDAKQALPPQPPEKIQMLSGIYLACMAAASILIAVGVDSMKRYNPSNTGSGGLSGLALLAATLKIMVKPNQLLLIAINIFIGLQQAFFGVDFTAAFVSCAVGTGSVGFVMMAYGSADAVGCIVTGYLAKVTGRMPLIFVATLMDLALFSTLLLWRPQEGYSHVLYIIAVLWGFCDSIWLVQINGIIIHLCVSICGILFPGNEEAGFTNFRLWESVGFIIAYLISPYFRTSQKTYVMLTLMIVWVLCYFYVEFKELKRKIRADKKLQKPCYVNGCVNFAFPKVD